MPAPLPATHQRLAIEAQPAFEAPMVLFEGFEDEDAGRFRDGRRDEGLVADRAEIAARGLQANASLKAHESGVLAFEAQFMAFICKNCARHPRAFELSVLVVDNRGGTGDPLERALRKIPAAA